MTTLRLEALRSDDSLGFLAAIGVVEACTTGLGRHVRLGWDGLGGCAVLETDFPSTRALAEALSEMANHWREDGRVLPPADQGLISKRLSAQARTEAKATAGGKLSLDPMRMDQALAVEAFARVRDQELGEIHAREAGRWLVGLVSQIALNDGRSEVTPVYAPRGQQTLYQLFEKHLGEHASTERIHEALTSWRRVDGPGTANLDFRDERDAVLTSDGKAKALVVPGANWLALLSVPFFAIRGERRGEVIGWRATGRGRPRELFWPIWNLLLDRSAIEVLLSHPLVRSVIVGEKDAKKTVDAGAFRALGVVAVMRARRQILGNSDGPLQRPEAVWP